jgi:hypothetical protein
MSAFYQQAVINQLNLTVYSLFLQAKQINDYK